MCSHLSFFIISERFSLFSKIFSGIIGVIIPKASKRYMNMNLMNDKANGSDEIVITMLFKINKTFNKRKNRALLTVRRSQKHYEIFSNNVLRKNITWKQLRLETIEIA